MSAPFTVPQCKVCGHLAYPPRILCPECGANDWTRTLADAGIVTEVTVRRPVAKRRQLPWGNWLDQEAVRLAAVHVEVGDRSVRIVARVPEGVETGDRVTLLAQASTAIALPGQVVQAQAQAHAAELAGPPAQGSGDAATFASAEQQPPAAAESE